MWRSTTKWSRGPPRWHGGNISDLNFHCTNSEPESTNANPEVTISGWSRWCFRKRTTSPRCQEPVFPHGSRKSKLTLWIWLLAAPHGIKTVWWFPRLVHLPLAEPDVNWRTNGDLSQCHRNGWGGWWLGVSATPKMTWRFSTPFHCVYWQSCRFCVW